MLKRFGLVLLIIMVAAAAFMPVLAQAPEAINDALQDLSTRVGQTVTLGTLQNWQWSQETLNAEACPDSAPPAVVGYQFLLTYGDQLYDYRVPNDRSGVFLCSITPLVAEEQADPAAPTATPEIDPENPPYSNPLCPQEAPEGIFYMPTRLTAGIQARVSPGLPNNLRAEPDVNGARIGEIPGGAIFEVAAGPSCDEQGRLWWQVNYDGLVGWTAEGVDNEYFVEPVPPVVLPESRRPITAQNAAFLEEVARMEGNLGNRLGFPTTAADDTRLPLVVLGALGSEGAWIYDLRSDGTDEARPVLRTLFPEQSIALLTELAFSEEPGEMVVGAVDRSVRLWDIRPGANLVERIQLIGHDSGLSAVAFRPDGEVMYTTGGLANLSEQREDNRFAILAWDVDTVAPLLALRGHTDVVTAMLFAANAELVSGSFDGTVRFWDQQTVQTRLTVEVGGAVLDLATNETGTLVFAALDNGNVLVIDSATGQLVSTFPAHTFVVTAVAVSGDVMVTAAADGTIAVWGVDTVLTGIAAEPITTLSGHVGAVNDLAFSPDGTVITSVGEDNAVRVWLAVEAMG
ncbi:MAG: hypothetical protein OHK0046_13420 [Anaerolineae bacterium]